MVKGSGTRNGGGGGGSEKSRRKEKMQSTGQGRLVT